MMKRFWSAAALALLLGAPSLHAEETKLLELTARRLGGPMENLSKYEGQVLLVVNTASRCGYTPQYEGLQTLYEEKNGDGFTILGFPSNDFGKQEPGSDEQIAGFCKRNYGVDFPMFSKVKVVGEGAHPGYAYLAALPDPVGGPVRWNFEKYLVDRNGKVVERFASSVTPEDENLRGRIEELLAR